MQIEWNQLSPRERMKFSRNAKESFRRTLLEAFLAHPNEPFVPTNQDLASLCNIPEHTAKRYLKHWKEQGVFKTKTKKHLHHAFGWCNQRTIEVSPEHVSAARMQLRLNGKVL
jgi:Fic family protein